LDTGSRERSNFPDSRDEKKRPGIVSSRPAPGSLLLIHSLPEAIFFSTVQSNISNLWQGVGFRRLAPYYVTFRILDRLICISAMTFPLMDALTGERFSLEPSFPKVERNKGHEMLSMRVDLMHILCQSSNFPPGAEFRPPSLLIYVNER
jgi:hypothetical protein